MADKPMANLAKFAINVFYDVKDLACDVSERFSLGSTFRDLVDEVRTERAASRGQSSGTTGGAAADAGSTPSGGASVPEPAGHAALTPEASASAASGTETSSTLTGSTEGGEIAPFEQSDYAPISGKASPGQSTSPLVGVPSQSFDPFGGQATRDEGMPTPARIVNDRTGAALSEGEALPTWPSGSGGIHGPAELRSTTDADSDPGADASGSDALKTDAQPAVARSGSPQSSDTDTGEHPSGASL
ncbi:MAG: hypothetical protein IT305_29800 [Chloroflexi bacterium]|nr:hypothetical protein [Chloroflexota bacterium]